MIRVYETCEQGAEEISVTVGGKPAPVQKAYVSAYPINCRWPGHQRPEYQRDLSYFVRFEADEDAEIVVKWKNPVQRAVLKPRSSGEVFSVCGDEIRFVSKETGGSVLVLDGFRNTIHFFRDVPQKNAQKPEGENVLYFGPGFHDVGIVQLHGGQTVYIDEAAVVYGGFHAENADNIRICGRGILDNSRCKEKIVREIEPDYTDADSLNAEREHTVQFIRCNNVRVEGIVIRDSLVYNITTFACRDFYVENVKLIGNWRYNSDGIDMHNTAHARVTGCFLRTYDDSVCIKGNVNFGDDCADILVENCVIWNDWGNALHVGVETCAERMHDIVFRHCKVIRVTGSALNIGNVDYGDICGVLYEDIEIDVDEDCQPAVLQEAENQPLPALSEKGAYQPPLFVFQLYRHHEYSVGARRGKIHGVTFRNIRITSPGEIRSYVYSTAEPIADVTFENIVLNGEKITSIEQLHFSSLENTENFRVRQ